MQAQILMYAQSTVNLVITGLENLADEAEAELGKQNIIVRRVSGVKTYEDLASLHDGSVTGKPVVYVCQVNDIFGTKLIDGREAMQGILEKYDCVDGVFRLGGESSGAAGTIVIKHHGQYVDSFK